MKKAFIAIALSMAPAVALAGFTCGSWTYTCNKGYYLSGTSCIACTTISSSTGLPTSNATTSGTGSTSHTSCYIPAGSGSDGTGSYTWPQCYSS